MPEEPVTENADKESDTDTESKIQSPEQNHKRASENEDSGSSSDVVCIEHEEVATAVESSLRETTQREANGKGPKESARQLANEDVQYDPSPSSTQEERQGIKNEEYDLRKRK